jgi:hypothetical protein
MSKGRAKEFSVEIDYCTFMVAIILYRHEVTVENAVIELTHDELAAEVNGLPFGDRPALHVHAGALHQGLHLPRT